MRNIIFSLVFILLFTSIISAEILIEEQPVDIYNLGDIVSIPITIKAVSDTSGSFEMDLLCNGNEINFYKNGISLLFGEEIKLVPAPSLVLTKDVIGEVKGDCKIRASLLEETALTNEFTISDMISLSVTDRKTELSPKESFLLEGLAIKENGNAVDGFIELEIIIDAGINKTETITKIGTIKNGYFGLNITISGQARAGNHLLKLKAYEKDFTGETTNIGFTDYNIHISQVPTSLEIFFENDMVEPGTSVRVKGILHDQTGEKIESQAILTIKDEDGKILEQTDIATDQFLEHEIPFNQPPAEWSVHAVSNKLSSDATFNISIKEEIRIFLINKTVIIANIGNVLYCNQTILVKIGNQSVNIDPCLEVEESQKYVLKAPDGQYNVEIVKDGESIISESLVLTGDVVEAKASSKVFNFKRYSVVWIFLIIILGVIAFIIFKKGYKRSFIGGYIKRKKGETPTKSEEEKKKISFGRKPLIKPKNPAEVSLSIRGNKQDASIIGLRIKNFKDIEDGKGNVSETLQKMINLAEHEKAAVNQSQNNIFFVLAPVRTKTFKNEKPALKLVQEIEKILNNHNKMFKQKIDFGLSLNYGEIIAKDEGNVLKFMAMKNLMISAKKVAEVANNEFLLSPSMNDRFGSDVKTEKHTRHGAPVYKVTKIIDRAEHAEFIGNFLRKLEKEKRKKG